MNNLLILILAYLLGSIPFGLILSRLILGIDVRSIGSGNIGATNVMRTGNKLLALMTLFLDAAKTALAVTVAMHFSDDALTHNAAGAISILGHIFPVWLRFRGGKGVASFLGAILVLQPLLAIGLLGFWVVLAKIFRISSLAALAGMILFALYLIASPGVFNQPIWFGVLLIIVFRHKDNIVRLIKGKESPFR